MSEKEIISIADNADMIINGFSFTINRYRVKNMPIGSNAKIL